MPSDADHYIHTATNDLIGGSHSLGKMPGSNAFDTTRYPQNEQLFAERVQRRIFDLFNSKQKYGFRMPPKVLHWAGENRKPWERVHPLARTKFDWLWWHEYRLMNEASGTVPVLGRCEAE